MKKTVSFSTNAVNVFIHVLTRCNLKCRHCYINPEQHGRGAIPLETLTIWMKRLAAIHETANIVFLGGEPTLHKALPEAVKAARRIGYQSITIDTNGYLFNNFLARSTPEDIDYISFSLDGATPETNDAIRGTGSYRACLDGIRAAVERGFRTSLIFTASQRNLEELKQMPPLLEQLGISRFFIQVLGLRGASGGGGENSHGIVPVSKERWLSEIPATAERTVARGVTVTYPKVFLEPDEPFACAGRVADNYFVFPNGRVYRCPLCEDYPIHSLEFVDNRLVKRPPLNEADLFQLSIPEGCVMNKLIQPGNLDYAEDGRPVHQIACCLLKEERAPADTGAKQP